MILVTMVMTEKGLRLADDSKELVAQTFRAGDLLDCEIKKHASTRSAEQQGLFHELVKRYSVKMHEPFWITKWRFKYNYGPHVTLEDIERDGPPTWSKGEWIRLRDIYPAMRGFAFLKSEGKYTVGESADVNQGAMIECSANGVYITDIVRTLAKHEEERGARKKRD